MKTTAIKLTLCALLGASMGAHAAPVLIPNGDFTTPGGSGFGSFASGGTVISYPDTGGNPDGYGKVDNTAGAWGGGLVAPEDTPAPNLGIPLATLGLVAGETYTFSMDMINLDGTTGIGGLKLESWDDAGGISNSGDMPATGQSSSWATYEWTYTIDAAATNIKVVPLLTPPTYGAGQAQSSIGFDNITVENTPVVPPPFEPEQIPNGDFESDPIGVDWATTETTPAYQPSGGNPGRYVELTDGVGAFAVLYAFDGAEVTFASLGLAPGDTYSVIMDMKIITAGTDPTSPIGGLRLLGPSGYDQTVYPALIGDGSTWETYTIELTVPAVVDPPTPEQVAFGLRPGKAASGASVGFDNVFIVLPSTPSALQASIAQGTAVSWMAPSATNAYQPQESPDNLTWTNLGPQIIGNTVTSIFDLDGSPFYQVLEGVPTVQDAVYNGNFQEDDGFDDFVAEGWFGVQSQPAERVVSGGRTDNLACMEIAVQNVGAEPNGSEVQQNTVNVLDPVNGTITPGSIYDFSFWANGVTAGTGGYVQQYIVAFLDEFGGITGTTGPQNFSSPLGVWTEITQSGLVAPAASASALIQILGVTGAVEGGGGGVLIDDVSLVSNAFGSETAIAATSAPAVEVSWPSKVGQSYQVRSSIDLSGWTNVTGVIPGNGSTKSWFEAISGPKEFYQVGELP